MNSKASATPRSAIPESHVTSRGGRYALRSSTLKRWTNNARIIRLADHAWMERINQPNSTSAIRNWMDSYASSALGR